MVSITQEDDRFVFEVKGWHKLWALRNQLTIPREHILNAYQDPGIVEGSRGLRMPGTYIPSIITAGTFIQNGDMIFWDVSKEENAIIIDLKDEHFKKLVIEVENPSEAIGMLKG